MAWNINDRLHRLAFSNTHKRPNVFPVPCKKVLLNSTSQIYLLTYLLTYSLTPWCRVLLQKLTGLQLVKKFPTFYGTRRFITALTSARHLSLSWTSLIQSIPPHPTSWISLLILSSHLRLGPCVLFPSDFPTKTLYMPLPSPYVLHARPSHSSRFYHPHNIGWAVQIF